VTTFALELEPDRANVSRARRFVTDAVHQLGRDALAEVVELLTSEVVTNAVLHAGTPVTLTVIADPDAVRIEVTDGAAVDVSPRNFGPEAATGRGLALVDALASRWGTRTEPRGKTVWFVVGQVDAA